MPRFHHRWRGAPALPNPPRPGAPAREPWQLTLGEFLGPVAVYDDFGPWAEALHLAAAARFDGSTLRFVDGADRVVPLPGGGRALVAYAVARVAREPRNAVLLERWMVPGGRWLPVGAYRGADLGLAHSARGRGLGAELVLETARARGGRTGDGALSPAGLGAHRAAHRLSVARALVAGRPVRAEVAAAHPGAVGAALAEVERRAALWRGALRAHPGRDLPAARRELEGLERAAARLRGLAAGRTG